MMARAKSEDKRNAILSAATEVFAERGLGAATSAISHEAGVAEGTLFTYECALPRDQVGTGGCDDV
jgi:AcrR family transcriptional regulator